VAWWGGQGGKGAVRSQRHLKKDSGKCFRRTSALIQATRESALILVRIKSHLFGRQRSWGNHEGGGEGGGRGGSPPKQGRGTPIAAAYSSGGMAAVAGVFTMGADYIL